MSKKQKPETMRIAYKYRAYCDTPVRENAIKWMLDMATVWNSALKERQDSYKASLEDDKIKPVNHKFAQYHQVDRKRHPELKHINIIALQSVLSRLHDSYKSFFALIKKDPAARPPREKQIHRVIELGIINQLPFGWSLDKNKLDVKNIGQFNIHLHRPIVGNIKTVTISISRGKWYVCFSCEVRLPIFPDKKKKNKIRLSFGDNIFVKDNSGHTIMHPHFYFYDIEKLRRLSRALSRKKKGSNNRRKARYTLGKWHERIANKRKYFVESVVNYYLNLYDIIEVPKLPLKQKITQADASHKAMDLCDAAYGMLIQKLKFGSLKLGKEVVEYAT